MPRTTKNILSEAETQRVVARVISALEYSQLDFLQPQVFSSGLVLNGVLDVQMNTPEMRLTDLDQTDPAGRYRLVGGIAIDDWRSLAAADHVTLQRAGGANWTSTERNILFYSFTLDRLDVGGSFNSSSGVLNLRTTTHDGTHGAGLTLYGAGDSTNPGAAILYTGSLVEAIRITNGGQSRFPDNTPSIGAAETPEISFQTDTNTGVIGGSDALGLVLNGVVEYLFDASNFQVSDNNNVIWGNDLDVAARIRTSATTANTAVGGMLEGTPVTTASPADSFFISHLTNGADIGIYISPAGNSYEMLKADASQIGVNIMTSANVPANTDMAAGQIRFVVDASDQLVGYYNDAGTVRTFVLGTFL